MLGVPVPNDDAGTVNELIHPNLGPYRPIARNLTSGRVFGSSASRSFSPIAAKPRTIKELGAAVGILYIG